MSYIYGLIVVALFFGALHRFTELDAKQKTLIGIVLAVIVVGAIGFNRYADTQAEHVRDVQMRYEQGKTILCNGVDVNKSTFSFSVGTYTFIGRENTAHYGQMFKAEKCQ